MLPTQMTKIRKLAYHKGACSHILVIPIEFVREARLQESYIKVTLLKDNKLLLEKVPT